MCLSILPLDLSGTPSLDGLAALPTNIRRTTGGLPIHAHLRYSSNMDVLKMLTELRQEHAQVEEAIIVLERLAQGHGKRRGRPPAWMTAANEMEERGRLPGSKNKSKAPTQT
jgi:hypothetical protein